MCRWLAYSATPVLLDELLYKPKYSLIDQSLHSRLGATATNGDGFGVGWYPDDARLQDLGDESRLIVSEPLGTLAGAWNAVPESSWDVIQPGQDEMHTFTPTHVVQ
jgi:predicted glutamine amidotransferase